MSRVITLIRGDGIGPEVIGATIDVLEAACLDFKYDEVIVGQKAIKEYKTPLPEDSLESIRKNKVVLKGPVTTPIGTGFRSVNVSLRQELDLYANIRPTKSWEGVPSKFDNLDIVVFRENTEGSYVGVEFESGSKEANYIIERSNGRIKPNSAISIKATSKEASEKIAKCAFEYAIKNNRKKVTVITKANIQKKTGGLFLETVREVAKEYKEIIIFEEMLVDAMAMRLVTNPENYDVLLTSNLFGDIISDECAGLVGGPGLAPAGNIGDDYAVFEAVHGSGEGIARKGIANPTATLLSATMMLNHLGMNEQADKIRLAIEEVLKEGEKVTIDLNGKATTDEMAQEIISKLN